MTIFDYLLLFILVCSIAIGMLRGLIKEILSLLGWILALVVANAYGDQLAALLPEVIPGHVTRLIVAFVALFIGVRLLTMLLAMLLDSFIKATGLSMADRGLGALFGLARGVVIVLAAVLVCGMTDIPQQDFWKNATLSPWAVDTARAVLPLLPDNVAKYVRF
ncbi:MAG TPA: CvpA family protein [Burkholderiaceae bacterium]|jgi:membrane protein required for colicin V production